MDCYDQIADTYDEMTNLKSRVESINKFVTCIKNRYNLTSVIDVACGTGGHVIAMSRLCIQAVGVDISEGMLDKAIAAAKEAGVKARWVNCPMQQLSQHVNDKFDIVLCLGNSLPHILSQEDLDETMSGFAEVLRRGGILLIQLLNYDRILKDKNRIVAITRKGNTEYIRFYDFLPKLIQFNLLKIEWQGEQSKHTVVSTPLFPYTMDVLEEALQKHQFSNINTYSDLSFNSFDKDNSPNLVIEAYL
jgi:ubiquinone/menaquinone biosynthesis C-methylase UbiE